MAARAGDFRIFVTERVYFCAHRASMARIYPKQRTRATDFSARRGAGLPEVGRVMPGVEKFSRDLVGGC